MWHRINGVFLLISAIAVGVVGYLVLAFLDQALRDNPDAARDISPNAVSFIRNRGALFLLITPALAAGLALVFSSRRGGWRWAVFIAGMVWMAVLLAGILYAFVSFLAPLYQYQPL